MGDEFTSDEDRSEGGGLRRQLEEALQKARDAEAAREAAVKDAEERGRQQATRRFDALEVFGKDRPGLAEAWVERNPEVDLTTDAAKEFAAKFGVKLDEATPPEPAPEPVAPEVRQAVQAFQQPVAAEPLSQIIEPDEFRKMLRDPNQRAEAMKADREGRVKKKLDVDPRLVEVTDTANFFAK